jgi:hypothetical protein
MTASEMRYGRDTQFKAIQKMRSAREKKQNDMEEVEEQASRSKRGRFGE